jgi:hypothetical protein
MHLSVNVAEEEEVKKAIMILAGILHQGRGRTYEMQEEATADQMADAAKTFKDLQKLYEKAYITDLMTRLGISQSD